VAQRYKPPFLFAEGGSHDEPVLAERPVIRIAPRVLRYGHKFIVIADDADGIENVSMVRTGFVTHTLNTDNRLVFLNFQKLTILGHHVLLIDAPFRGAQAIPGDYMLFVVNENGVPGVARHVRLALN
jgi:hypothetical protein